MSHRSYKAVVNKSCVFLQIPANHPLLIARMFSHAIPCLPMHSTVNSHGLAPFKFMGAVQVQRSTHLCSLLSS